VIPVAFSGIRFEEQLGVSASFAPPGANGPASQAVEIDRANDAPILLGTRQSARTLTVNFQIIGVNQPNGINQDFEITRKNLLAALDPRNKTARTLTVQFSKTDTTQFDGLCRIGQYRFVSITGIEVDFLMVSDVWSERTDTTTISLSISAAVVIPLENRGGAAVDLTLKTGWSANKTGNAYKYLRTTSVTNNGDRAWTRRRITIDLGDTAAWVTAAKAQSDGDDVIIRRGRHSLARTLTNFNTKRTFAHIFDTIKKGETATYEIWYGNPGASNPATLSVRTVNADDYAADDLQGDSGTATAGAASTLTDGGKAWEVNRWRFGYIHITGGTGSGQRRQILSNTATVVTVSRAWDTNPGATSTYAIWMTGISVDGGKATSAGNGFHLDDTSQAWNVNEWAGGLFVDVTNGVVRKIISNTATRIVWSGSATAPALNDVYYLERYGLLNWMVNTAVISTAHRGLWRLNHYYSSGGQVWYGDVTPGGWVPWPMLINQDDFAQGRWIDEGAGGGHAINNWPGQYSRRAVKGENTWPQKRQADGVAIHDERGFIGFTWDYRMTNVGGIGQVQVRSQEKDGDDWNVVDADTTTHATLTAVTSAGATGYQDFTGDDVPPVRIWTGVLPLDDDGVIAATAKKSYTVELRDNTFRKALLSLDDWGDGGTTGGVLGLSAESDMYDHQPTMRLGGGPSSERPYTLATVNSGVKLASGQELWINGDPKPATPLLGIYASNALVKRVPHAATIREYISNLDGVATPKIPRRLLALPPTVNLLGTSADSATGWTKTDSGVTSSALATSTTSGDFLPGHTQSTEVTITAPNVSWSVTLKSAWIPVTPDTLYEFGFWMKRNGTWTSVTGITFSMKVEWADALGVSNSADPDQTISATSTVTNTWGTNGSGRHVYAGPPDDGVTAASPGPTTQARVTLTLAATGAVTGVRWRIGTAVLGSAPINLYVDESGMGTITFRSSYREAVYA
jgi:hypothetical protein